jgi:hypothetical protein
MRRAFAAGALNLSKYQLQNSSSKTQQQQATNKQTCGSIISCL